MIARVLIILTMSLIWAAFPIEHIVVYNDGMAMVQESRSIILSQKNDVTFTLENIPVEMVEKTLVIQSKNVDILSRTFVTPNIDENTLLRHFIGEELELVKFGEDGAISYQTKGILKNDPRWGEPRIFEIEGQIIVNPPYRILFPRLPREMSPHIICTGKSKSKTADLDLQYMVSPLNWHCDYALTVDGSKGALEGWFTIGNNTYTDWDPEEITLVSGSIKMPQNHGQPTPKQLSRAGGYEMMDAAAYAEPFAVTESEDYALFKIAVPQILAAQSQQQFKYVSKGSLAVSRDYQINHSLYHRGQTEQVPVNVSFTFEASDVGDYQHPAGEIMIYENTDEGVIFIGSNHTNIVPEDESFKIQTGRTRDVTAQFTLMDYERNQRTQYFDLTAEFKNHKDDAVRVEWLEQLSGEWEVRDCSTNWEKMDANRIRIWVDLKPEEIKSIDLSVRTN